MEIKGSTKTASSITYQTLFKYYHKLAGMTVRHPIPFCIVYKVSPRTMLCVCRFLPVVQVFQEESQQDTLPEVVPALACRSTSKCTCLGLMTIQS